MMNMGERIIFVLGDKLPTIYDVAISIYNVVSKPNSGGMKNCIQAYVTALINVWIKSFGKKHLITRTPITKKVETIIKHYQNNVYIEATRRKPKHKGEVMLKKSVRQLNREWSRKSISWSKKQKSLINGLFDIGCNMDKLTGDEREFYIDQQATRIGSLSKEIDTEFAIEEQQEEEQRAEATANAKMELQYMMDVEDEVNDETDEEYQDEDSLNVSSSSLNISRTRSGHSRVIANSTHVGVQINSEFGRPKIRKTRDCTNEIKATCAEVSVRCNISTEQSRIAVQTVCRGLYNHNFYLSKEEAIEHEPSLEIFKSTSPKPSKRSKPKEKIPSSINDYRVYENVLPTPKTLNDFKQVLAIQHERDAAVALSTMKPGTKVTLHFDATSRSKIDGDWPCLILIFSDNRRFSLRPLFFAFEDRAQIIRLIVETLMRLAATISTPESESTAATLWEKITALMTDSVSKNLHIGEGVAKDLDSKHVPLHLLCKSHPVEAFDRSNLAVLESIEKKVEFRKKLETINPSVRSFLRGKTVVECAINSILSLVSHDKSANSTNQADLFDHILQREGQVKHIAMYYERRFTKLGYSAASILQAMPYLRMLLDETHLSNQHVEIVRMFLDSEFLLTELSVLAYFTHTITLPFLHFVEVNTQEDLLEMFPRLYKDLLDGKMDTLKDYVVHYPHVKVKKPSTDLELQILNMMTVATADVFSLQAGREYGFGKHKDEAPRATQLHLLSPEERDRLPTNNLDSERQLSVFGKRAPVAKFRNKKFTAKGIRNDVTLFKSQTFKTEPCKNFNSIVKILSNMETRWVAEQKTYNTQRILAKIEKGKNQTKYTQKCLQACKSWGGPATTVEELNKILQERSDTAEKILRTELSYYRDTHKADVIQQPDLFRVNNISSDDQLLNFCALLSGNDPMSGYVNLPSNKDVLKLLPSCETNQPTGDEDEERISVGMMYITLVSEGDVNTWYLAVCTEECSGTYNMDFLQRVDKSSNLIWKHPSKPDRATLRPESIIQCVIDGDWDVSKQRNMTFTLRNHTYVDTLVMDCT